MFAAVAASWLASASALAAESWRFATDSRVVAFGDVHGAYDALVELLRAVRIVDDDLHWSAGTTHVVSLGDLLDRGAASPAVIDLVMRLQREAETAGGRLHVVAGNHELMNLLGDWRYVARDEYAAFVAEESEAMRTAAYAVFAAGAETGDSPATRAAFDAAYPLGFFARQAAFAPAGRYGAWLRSLPAIVVVNDTAYVHGGLPPVVADQGLDINERLHADLERYLALRDRLVAGGVLSSTDRRGDVETAEAAVALEDPTLAAERDEFLAVAGAVDLGAQGPLWYRGSLLCKPVLEEPTLAAGLARLGVVRAVVGHTPTADRRARALYGGRLVALDTGMLADYFHGRAAALFIEGDRLEVQYVLPPERAPLDSGHVVAYARTAAELRTALERGEVASVERTDGALPWKVVLRYEDEAIGAWFYPRRSDRASDFELAAAALDDLLGTGLVAPTVERAIEGQGGALQLRFADAVTDAERVERKLAFSGWCAIEPQVTLMHAFDLLTLNRGRGAANVVFNNDLTDLTLMDFGRAFATERALPAAIDPATLDIPASLRASLRALDETTLVATLGRWLDSRRIRALLARRDRLVMGR